MPALPWLPETLLLKFSTPMPKVLTSFLTKLRVWGVMVASLTPALLSKLMA